MSTEYLYENGYDMIDRDVEEHLETEEDLMFNCKEDDSEGEFIDQLITPEDEQKARAAIAIEDSYERSLDNDLDNDD